MTDNGTNVTNVSAYPFNEFYFYKEQFILLGVLFFVIVSGNLGVLFYLTFGRTRKSRMNYFITHLALADLSVGFINVLTDIIWKITVEWYAGNIGCKIVKFSQVLVTYASNYVLVALSIDRYNAVCHPMNFSGKRARWLIITAWFFSALHSIPILFLYEEVQRGNIVQCWMAIDEMSKVQLQIYMSLVSLTVFIVPAAIITYCYTIIIFTIWSKNTAGFIKNVRNSDDCRRASSRGIIPKAKVKTIKITLVIVTAFIACWSPYIVYDMLQVFDQVDTNSTQSRVALATLMQSLAPLNSAANPIIYCIFSTHFCGFLCSIPPFKWCYRWRKNQGDSTSQTQTSSLSEFLTNTHNKKRLDDSLPIQVHAVLID